MSGRKIYSKREYSIYKVSTGFIVHNTKKRFQEGHTHCNNYYKAKSLIHLAINKKVPNKANKWEIESLIRITKDKKYLERLKNE